MKRYTILYYPLVFLFFLPVFLSGCDKEDIYHEVLGSASLTIERADNQEPNQITVRFIPNEHTISSMYALGTEDDRASFESGTFVGIRKQQGNSPFEFTYAHLDPNTTYVVYARAFDSDGKSSTLSSLKLKTYTDAIQIEPNFIGVRSAAFTVTTSGDYYRYVYAFGRPSDREAFTKGTLSGIKSMEEQPQYTLNNFDLQPEGEYAFFLQAYDRGGYPTKVYEVPFSTSSTALSPAISSFSVNTPNLLYRSFSVAINDKCSKATVLIGAEGEFDAYLHLSYGGWTGRIKDMIASWENLGIGYVDAIFTARNNSLTQQTASLFLGTDPFDKPYEAYILLYDVYGEVYSVERFTFKSPSLDTSAAAAGVKIDRIVVEPTRASYHISWDDKTIGLAYQTYEAEYYATLSDEEIYTYLISQVIDATGARSQVISEETVSTSYPYTDYTGKTIYFIIAGINKNGLAGGLGAYVRSEFVAGKTQ